MKDSKLTKEWSKFIPSEGYEKEMQDIKLHDGRIVSMCWPNADIFNSCETGSECIPAEEVAFVRRTHNPKW